MSLLLVHRNKTSAYCSRLPLILLPWGLQQSPHSLPPRGWGEFERLYGALVTEHTLLIVSCQSPFCTRGRRDPGLHMHHIGYEKRSFSLMIRRTPSLVAVPGDG